MEDENDPRRRRNPFDAFDDIFEQMGMDADEFDRMFREMHRNLMDAMKRGGIEPGKPFVHGFSFKMGPDGRPHIEHFGNRPPRVDPSQMRSGRPLQVDDAREPLTDIIEGKDDVAVTLEIPGVEKSDIQINAKRETLEIAVDNDHRKYHKVVRLPAKVDPETTRATYKNGILDVTVKKVGSDEPAVNVTVE